MTTTYDNVLTFAELRAVNSDRHQMAGWDRSKSWSLLEWAGAMCGEAGEAANVAKKIPGGQETIAHLAEELADTIIYVDLLAHAANIDLAEAVREKFNRVSERKGLPHRL